MKPIYLDYNATTPIAEEVLAAMLPYLKNSFGNPSSSHQYGVEAKKGVVRARAQIAAFLNCSPEEIIFTSGGTEANNLALKGTAYALREKGSHIITSVVEHPAVLEVCRYLAGEGFETTYLPVDEFGMVNPAEMEKAIRPTTILITIMHANNEVGTIQPIAEISRIARERGVLFHTDAAQSAAKIPVKVDGLGVDMLSLAGHKVYAPKGVGALYLRKGVKLIKQMHGAGHESGIRAGTENVPYIAALGEACALADRVFEMGTANMRQTRDRLHCIIADKLLSIRLNGHPEKRLPNTLSLSFPKIKANHLLDKLTEVAASPGAACHTDSVDISHVLKAMKVPAEYAMGAIRFSTGRSTTIEEIERAGELVVKAVEEYGDDAEEKGLGCVV